MVSEMPEYESAQSWFVQALPALNKYVRLDSSMAVNVRFKVQTPTNSLSVENPGDALFYLGFDTKSSTTPRLNGITQKTEESPWARVDYTTDIVIFHPTTFRAPCLHGFQNFQVGTAPFGSIYNAEFVSQDPRFHLATLVDALVGSNAMEPGGSLRRRSEYIHHVQSFASKCNRD